MKEGEDVPVYLSEYILPFFFFCFLIRILLIRKYCVHLFINGFLSNFKEWTSMEN